MGPKGSTQPALSCLHSDTCPQRGKTRHAGILHAIRVALNGCLIKVKNARRLKASAARLSRRPRPHCLPHECLLQRLLQLLLGVLARLAARPWVAPAWGLVQAAGALGPLGAACWIEAPRRP
jgi:hypothetical protein